MRIIKFTIRTFVQLHRDNVGLAISSELITLATVALVGLLVSLGALRDSLVSELSDIGGAVQDLQGSYLVTGVTGPSSAVAGMSFDDAIDAGDSPGDQSGVADNCIAFEEPPSNEAGSAVAAEAINFGPGADHADQFFTLVDGPGPRLNIEPDPEFTQVLDAGTYDVQDVSFLAESDGNGEVIAFLAIENAPGNFETIWVSDVLEVQAAAGRTDFEINYAAGAEQFTLTSSATVFSGVWQDGIARVVLSARPTATHHDNFNVTQPTALGQTISGFSNFGLTGRTYVYSVNVAPGN